MIRHITNYQPIHKLGEQIGYLQTIETKGYKHVQIEYYIDKEHRNQGIMSNFLPPYLRELQNEGIKAISAIVKKHNHASKKLLKRNGFMKFTPIRGYETFLLVNL